MNTLTLCAACATLACAMKVSRVRQERRGEETTTTSEVAVNVMNGMRGDITYPDCKSTAASAVIALDTVLWRYVLYVHVSVLTRYCKSSVGK